MRTSSLRTHCGFQDTRSYRDRMKAQQEKTGRKDALVIGEGAINGARWRWRLRFRIHGRQHGIGRR